MKYFRSIFLLSVLSFSISISAQKKVLDHTVYDSWKSISNISLTHDGKFSVAVVKEQEGNDYLLVKNIHSSTGLILPRGYKYAITPDQKQVIAQVKAPFQDTRQAKIKKVANEKLPKDSLAIITLKDFSVTKIASVKDFKIGKDYSDYFAYTLDDTIKVKDKNIPKAHTLIVRDLLSTKEDTIKNVTEYIFSRNGKSLSVALSPHEKDSIDKPKVLLINLNPYKKSIASEGQTIYKNLALSDSGEKLAFLATSDSLKQEIKEYKLFYFENNGNTTKLIADKNKTEMFDKWSVSGNYVPTFSKNEKRLLLGTAPITLPKDTTIPDFEKAQLNIWHWQEPQVQPMQWAELKKKEKQTYLAFIDLENEKFHQLGTEEIPEVTISDENNGRFAIGLSNLNSRFEVQWDIRARTTYDVWIFDLQGNTKKQIKTDLAAEFRLSPLGNYLAWYDFTDRQYHVYSMKTGSEVCMTNKLDVNFWDEKYDQPSSPNSYGFMDWTENDEAILVYDAYDIWKIYPDGKSPENITKNTGRNEKIKFRYIKTDPESRFIKSGETILLSAFDNTTKEHGFYELRKQQLKKLITNGYTYPTVVKAKEKNIFAFVKNNFNTSPDLYVTSDNWKSETKLSDINPQMQEYNWGTAELASWTTFDGKPTQGIVYKPENFDPNKKYPMMIYFYEKHSDNLYQYFAPAPSRSTINIPFYCSRGYIVFTPDIQYTIGHPGESAYNSIVSGAEMMVKNHSWVDKDNIAIQGQSWGGYQVSYLVTRTNMFKAAGAGAPVSNMFSAYGGIRWETGRSRQYQYEQTQSRLGATMWEAPELYLENSPVFFADKVRTPILIMHNDNDGAVPWYQGIEYFMALRRLGKPSWLLQYNNEAHNLVERRNSKDLSIRLQQFFDHYLKGDPIPVWMKTGIPATEKGRTYGFDFE